MNTEQFLAWGVSHNWPQLVLCRETNEVLRSGELSWWHFIATGTQEQCARAIERVEEWEMRVERARARREVA